MKLVILSLLFVVSFAHGAAAPPADDADALRRRIAILEDEKAALKVEKAALVMEKSTLMAEKALLCELMNHLAERTLALEIGRIELGALPKSFSPNDGGSMDDAVAASLADKDKARTAEVVVRGMVEADPAQPKDEWPTYNIVVAHVFKATPEARLLGTTLTVKSKSNRALKGPVTLYLVFDKQQKVYLLQHGERGFSHVGPHAALPLSDPALGPK